MCQTVSWLSPSRYSVNSRQACSWSMSTTACRAIPSIQPALVTTGTPANWTGSNSTRWVGTSTTTPSTPRLSGWPRRRRRSRRQVGDRHQRHGVASRRASCSRVNTRRDGPIKRAQGQHADRVGTFPGQRLGGDVRPIAEFLDGPVDPLAHVGTDVRCVVDHPRHRLLRDPGPAGDVDHDHPREAALGALGCPHAGPSDYVVRL